MKNLLIIVFICIISITGCKGKIDSVPRDTSNNADFQDDKNDKGNDNIEVIDKSLEEVILESMTLEEKVAQLFIMDFSTFINGENLTYMTRELEEKMKIYPIGGYIFFSANIVDKNQLRNFINDLQFTSKIKSFISVDEEGGRVSRIGSNKEMIITKVPEASIIGETLDYEYAYNVYRTLGEELKEIGFNMNFAPVSDINTNPNNPVIGTRAFSSDKTIVSLMIAQAINGLQDQGVASITKHFPGHGDTVTDTHTGAVIIEHNKERLKEIELIPFYKAIEEDVTGIMVAHINLPNITNDDMPASLSKEIITDLLREEMKYKGLVITDALNMKAITDKYNSEEACVYAILAGVDILVMPEDFDLAFNGIINGLKEGIISEERINESVLRILRAKIKLNIIGDDINIT